MNFTAIDFETANQNRASICSVGLVRVENGKIVKEIHQLINPRAPFNFYNTVVHGITAFDVRNAPTFDDFFCEMSPFLQDAVVAHNAAFDISCLRSEIERYAIPTPNFKYFCTLCMSRRINEAPRHKLDCLAEFYELGEFNHHNALADARICAKLFDIFTNKIDTIPLAKPFCCQTKAQRPRVSSFLRYAKTAQKTETSRQKITPQTELIFDYSPIDFTKKFVVTGDFVDLTIRDIEGLILREGGSTQRHIDDTVDYVIVGDCPAQHWDIGEFGKEIDDALNIGKARFVRQSHFLKEIR